MTLTLGDLRLGKVDGKFEYAIPERDRDSSFFDAFLIPEGINTQHLNNRDLYFVEGFRGTGKTSLLRWHAENCRSAGALTEFVLFKSDLPEENRLRLSTEVGITWLEVDQNKMEFAQDFKSAWTWFIFHKIGEVLARHPTVSTTNEYNDFARLLGLKNSAFDKVLSFLPRLDKASVTIKADLDFFAAELGGEFVKRDKDRGFVTLGALNQRLRERLQQIDIPGDVFVFFDELEVFYENAEKYHRDQRMVRDLLFSVSSLNDLCAVAGIPIHIIAAVRSEVLDSLGAIGQEVERVVHDKGIRLAWHYANRSLNHPLFTLIAKKISLVDKSFNGNHIDLLRHWFPGMVMGEYLDAYMLDRSFYKPRDLIWRLTIAQKQYPNEHKFSEDILRNTEIEYSSQMWDEIKYEMSANYSSSEIDVIEMVLSGFSVVFDLSEIEERFLRTSTHSVNTQKLLANRSVREIMRDLYRLGAVGNFFRVGKSAADIRNRWSFRGDPGLLPDKRMTMHPGLVKRLSMVHARRRGSRGAGRD